MPPPAPLPASILVALGLTGCPRPQAEAADPAAVGRALGDTAATSTGETGAPGTGDTGTTTPCLAPPVDSGDTGTTAPSLDSGDTGTTTPSLDSGDTGKYGACLCACDVDGGAGGGTLALPVVAALAARRRSRREILDDLAATGVLPADLAARLRGRR